ncbi:MAG TPA: hypothetical protein VF119_01005 [Candidatus Limnocylindrales bacterium]
MTTERRLERDLPGILGDLAMAPYPDYIDDVLAVTAQRRQRPTWTFPERWLPMDLATTRVPTARVPWRAVGILAMIGLLIAAAVAVYIGSQPRLPPPFGLAANGLIAASIDGDIHLIDPTTGSSTPIVTGAEPDIRVAVAPPGTHIVFERELTIDDRPTYQLVVARTDGSELHAITPVPSDDGFDFFAWAPDGRSVIVDMPLSKGIWLLDAIGSAEPRQLLENGQLYESPFRPPDGSAILVQHTTGASRQMLSVDVATGQSTILAEGRAGGPDLDDARWSPDGSAVVYHTAPDGDSASLRLFIVDADGTDARQITHAPGIWWDIDPTWSPNGDRIAFDRYEKVGNEWLVRPLVIYDVASGASREVGPLARDARAARPNAGDATASFGEGMYLEWSPDGTTLLAIPGEGTAHPVLIDVATGAWRNLDAVVTPDAVSQSWQRIAP